MNCRGRCDVRQHGRQGEVGPGLEVERQLGIKGQEEGGTQPGVDRSRMMDRSQKVDKLTED